MKSFKPIYVVFAVYIPISVFFGFLLLVTPLLEPFFGPLPLSVLFIQGFICAICASLYYMLIRKSKSENFISDMRGVIVLCIISYFLTSIMHFEKQASLRFYPSLYNIPAVFCAIMIWFPVLTIKRVFSEQELFESYMQHYSGEKLRQILLEDSSLLSETSIGIKKIISNYILFFVILFLLLIVCRVSDVYLNLFNVFILVSIFIIGIFIIAFLFFLGREYAYAAQGLKLQNRPKAIMSGIIIIFAALFMAFLVSSDKSLLPPSLLVALLQFFIGLFGRVFRTVNVSNAMVFESPVFDNPVLPFENQDVLEDKEAFAFWNWLKYIALAAAAVLFLWFMINPLLNRSGLFRGLKTWPRRIINFIISFISSFYSTLTYFIRSLFEGGIGKKIHPDSIKSIRQLEESLYAAYSRVKQKELKKSISLFARLILWGEEVFNIIWKPSYAPIEYCIMLAKAVKYNDINMDIDIDKKILCAGSLFEKALYSSNILSKADTNEFSLLIETIISTRRDI